MRFLVVLGVLTGCVTNSRVEKLERAVIQQEFDNTRTRASLVNELCTQRYQECLMSDSDVSYCREFTRSCFNSFRIK